MVLDEKAKQLAINTIRCKLISDFQDREITITDFDVSFEGIISTGKVDYDKIIVKGTYQMYELWYDSNNGKFAI